MEVLTIDSVTKRFGAIHALDAISIHLKQGEIYGFLGLNGAGKTTLIRILLGMIKPDEGNVFLFGAPLTAGFKGWNDIGYLVESANAYPNLSVMENLQVYFTLRQLNRPSVVLDIIDQLRLTRYKHILAKNLSLGNLQRLSLAKALMHRPKLLLLDEPTNGLDPQGILEVRQLLKDLAQQGTTVFVSSHILGEMSKMAHRIGIIHEGRLIKELTSQELSNRLNKKLIVHTSDNQRAIQILLQAQYTSVLTDDHEIEISGENGISNPDKIAKLLVEHGLPPSKLYPSIEDLEMFFLRSIQQQVK